MRKNMYICAIITLFASLLYTRILFFNPTQNLIGDGGDNNEYFGYINLIYNNIKEGRYPYAYTTTYLYPIGFDLSYGYDGALFVTLGALLSFLVSVPLAYNITAVVIFWLNFIISYICFYKIVRLASPHDNNIEERAFFGALLFGWSPYVFARLNGHMNLFFIGGIPLMCYAVIRMFFSFKKGHIVLSDFLWISLGLLLIAGGSVQYMLIFSQIVGFFTFFLLPYFIFLLLNRKLILSSHNINTFLTYAVIACIVFLIPFLFFFGGYIQAILLKEINMSGITYTHNNFRPQIIDLFIPNSSIGLIWQTFNVSKSTLERVVTFGIVGWIAIIGHIALETKTFYRLMQICLLLLLFSMTLYLKPLFVPEYSRIWIFISFPVILILIFRMKNISRYILYILILCLCIEKNLYQVKSVKVIPNDISYAVQQQPGKAVFHIPINTTKSFRSSLPFFWKKSIMDGTFLHTARKSSNYAFIRDPDLNRFICETQSKPLAIDEQIRTWEKLKSLDISTIVLIKEGGDGEPWWFSECANLRELWKDLYPDYAIPSSTAINHDITHGRSSLIKSSLHFPTNGLVSVERITIWPRWITDISLKLPNGQIVNPQWNKAIGKKDLIYDFDPRLTFAVNAGNKLEISSDKKVYDGNAYISIYYTYIPSNKNFQMTSFRNNQYFPLKLLKENDAMEVYSLE